MQHDFKQIAEAENNPAYIKNIFSILGANESTLTKDGISSRSHSITDINEVKEEMWQETLGQRALAGEHFQSMEEGMKSAVIDSKKMTTDGFFNPMTGIGTMNDPGMYNQANIPMAISPMDATALFASGGLPEIIINKKSKGILINGYNFDSTDDFWKKEGRIPAILERHSQNGFEDKLAEALQFGFIYGGAVCYPVLKRDNALTYDYTMAELLNAHMLDKGCISRWTNADRWNTVFVPNYIITAADYLFAKRYYIPLAGVSVSTERSAVIRPKKLPYWGAIRQLGWGMSDFEGYIRSIFGYQLMIASIPIMAQQMSLLMYEMNLDGVLATTGLPALKELMALNDEQMREWSMANPRTINAAGKVYTVNRTYAGYDKLGELLKNDICAQSGIPDAVLFHTQSKGFTNNTEEELLKQSETIRLSQKQILPSLTPLKDLSIYDTFGQDSEEAKHKDTLRFTFDNPVVATEAERAESAARFAATVNSLAQAGMPLRAAILQAQQFFKSINVPEEVLKLSDERDMKVFNDSMKKEPVDASNKTN
jgi:hypothetical protein